jgi:hypothetical protein
VIPLAVPEVLDADELEVDAEHGEVRAVTAELGATATAAGTTCGAGTRPGAIEDGPDSLRS